MILRESRNFGRVIPFGFQPFKERGAAREQAIPHQFVDVNAGIRQFVRQINQADFLFILEVLRGIGVHAVKPFPGFLAGHAPGFINHPGARQFGFNFVLTRPVKNRRDGTETEAFCRPTQVRFKHLTNIHTPGNTQRIQDNVHRAAVFQERHILNRHNHRDHTLVSVAPRHLIASHYLAALGNRYAHHLINPRGKVRVFFTREYLNIHNNPTFAVRHLERGVFHVARFLPKDCAQQALFRGQLFLALGGYFSNQDGFRPDFSADPDDTALIQVADGFITDVGDFAGDFFRSQLGIPRFHLVLFNVHAGVAVFFDEAFRNQDGVFKVITFPGYESRQNVLSKRQLSIFRGRGINNHITFTHDLALVYCRALVYTGGLIGTLIFAQVVFAQTAVRLAKHKLVAGDLNHFGVFFRDNHLPGVCHSGFFHSGRNNRNFRTQQRHGLSLHVGAHQGAVGIVMLQERNQRSADAHHLIRSHIHVIDVLIVINREGGMEAAGIAVQKLVVFVQRRVRLRDNVLIFRVGGEIYIFIRNKRAHPDFFQTEGADFGCHFGGHAGFSLKKHFFGDRVFDVFP